MKHSKMWVWVVGMMLVAATARGQVASRDGAFVLVDQVPEAVSALPANVRPDKGQPAFVNWAALRRALSAAPMRGTPAEANPAVVSLPMPGGWFASFAVVETQLLHPNLAKKYPEIKTYRAVGLDDPTAIAALDVTPQGFHAMVVSAGDGLIGGTVYIDPWSGGDRNYVTSYYKRDLRRPIGAFGGCGTAGENLPRFEEESGFGGRTTVIAKKYRVVCCATAEYTAYHSALNGRAANIGDGLYAVTTALNRVETIFEKDLNITFEMIEDSDGYIFTNPTSDPFTNSTASVLAGQNQAHLDWPFNVGNGGYDIGHVVTAFGGGGVGSIAGVCVSGQKGRGATGRPAPINDPFWVDYLSHEFGHQFGAEHTFNANSGGSCTVATRAPLSAFEPGSGSTIMAYGGICTTAANYVTNSDPYFHFRSIQQIRAHISGTGSCGADIPTTNDIPTVTIASPSGVTIPVNTPFRLDGAAFDPDDNAFTYCWEEYDLGPAADAPTLGFIDNGASPISRSYLPVTRPWRTVPEWEDIRDNISAAADQLPQVARSMQWTLTVRDQSILAGVGLGVYSFNVAGGAGPFQITSPSPGQGWSAGPLNVTWNVAGTNVAPVSCSAVDILLSSDGGNTFPIVLAQNVANDGSETVNLPDVPGNFYRVMIRSRGNIFFTCNRGNFAIGPSPTPTNDNCIAARVIGNGTHGENLLRANPSPVGSVAGAPNESGHDVWFRYTATCSGVVAFDCGNRSVSITVYGPSCPNGDSPITSDEFGVGDNYVASAVMCEPGDVFLVRIADRGGENIAFNMTVSCTNQPADNDDCANAVPISPGVAAGSLLNSTYEAGEYANPSIWYRLTAPVTGTIDCEVPADRWVGRLRFGCGDMSDIEWGPAGQYHRMTFECEAGAQYLIGVYAAGLPLGPVTLTTTAHASPVNDRCSGATPLYVDGTTPGTLLGARRSVLDPAINAGSDSADVYYTFTPPTTGTLTIGITGWIPGFAPGVILIQPLDCGASNTADYNFTGFQGEGMPFEMVYAVQEGTTYLVRVTTGEAYGQLPGTFGVRTDFVAQPPANDSIANAEPLYGVMVQGTTYGATVDGSANCGNSNATGDVWYRWLAPCTGTAAFSTLGSAFDTVLSIHNTTPGTLVTQIACNDDAPGGGGTSAITASVVQGNAYFIRVSGFAQAFGDFALRASWDSPSLTTQCPCSVPLNGSFEKDETPGQSNFDHWTTYDVELIGDGYPWPASQGRWSVNVNGLGQGWVSQDIFTPEIGGVYTVLFDMAANPQGGDRTTTMRVSASGGNQVVTYSFTFDGSVLSESNLGWSTRTYSFVATSPTTTILFEGDPDDTVFGPMLDNVRLQIGSAADSRQESWNFPAQFSATNNPSGVWRIGSTNGLGGAFTNFTTAGEPFGSLLSQWSTPAFGNGIFVLQNRAGAVRSIFDPVADAEFDVPPDQVLFNPSAARPTGVRFTAPQDGIYSFNTVYEAVLGQAASPRILVNRVEVGRGPDGTNRPVEALLYSLSAGDDVDFVTESQFDGYADSSVANITVTRISDLPPVGGNCAWQTTGCTADQDGDGDVDSDDIVGFFTNFENGELCGDQDNDGDVDSDDIVTFFALFDQGGC